MSTILIGTFLLLSSPYAQEIAKGKYTVSLQPLTSFIINGLHIRYEYRLKNNAWGFHLPMYIGKYIVDDYDFKNVITLGSGAGAKYYFSPGNNGGHLSVTAAYIDFYIHKNETVFYEDDDYFGGWRRFKKRNEKTQSIIEFISVMELSLANDTPLPNGNGDGLRICLKS